MYPGAAHLDELAAQVRAAWDADPANPQLTKLILDAGLFGGDEWEPSWDPAEREFGYMSNIPPSRSTATGTPARTRRGAAATRSGAPAMRSPSSAASP